MTNHLLSFDDVVCGYGDTEILHGVSGGVAAGRILGVFGRNGVGKTTLSRVLVGEIPVLTGGIKLNGKPIEKTVTYARRRRGIGYMPQVGMVFDNLTVRENLSLSNATSSLEPYFETFPRLAERLDQLAGSMSGGERKILSFVRTMLEETEVTILDEPSEGVQPENIVNMQNCIRAKQEQGHAFILVEQNLSMLMALADTYVGLEAGQGVFEADKSECNRDDLLKILSV
ncbi:ABC transporter ATP-binding protein [Tateyamaria sp.]|uniref:ABC transporter ATP-binding protein n=1 Tax=Tateyamaria sp. TaxID=1929288 RepID=UPI00329E8D15